MAHLGEKLRDFRQGKNMSQTQMADYIEVGFRTYQEIEKSGVVKKSDVLSRIKEKTGIEAQKIAQPGKINKKVVTENKHEANEKDLPAKAIYNLTESSKDLSEANRILADNESRLISLLETTVGSQKGNPAVAAASVSDLLEWIAEVGSGKKWGSKQEALAELHSFVYGKKKNIG